MSKKSLLTLLTSAIILFPNLGCNPNEKERIRIPLLTTIGKKPELINNEGIERLVTKLPKTSKIVDGYEVLTAKGNIYTITKDDHGIVRAQPRAIGFGIQNIIPDLPIYPWREATVYQAGKTNLLIVSLLTPPPAQEIARRNPKYDPYVESLISNLPGPYLAIGQLGKMDNIISSGECLTYTNNIIASSKINGKSTKRLLPSGYGP